jgi:hypothetical protein
MIKALFLIFGPAGTWERIAEPPRSVVRVLFLFLLPTILLSIAGELAGVAHWGRHQNSGIAIKVPEDRLLMYGAAQLALNLAAVFIAAMMIKSITGTFQKRYTFASAFALVSYGLSPLFLVHLSDAFPSLNPWVSFGIGIVLSIATIYSGVPRLMQPDPPHAFGVFITSAMLLIGLTGIARLISLLVLIGRVNEFSPV